MIADAGASGSELCNYQPYNSLDLSEIMGSDNALAGIADQQNGKNLQKDKKNVCSNRNYCI